MPKREKSLLVFFVCILGRIYNKNSRNKTIKEKPNAIKIELDYSEHSEYSYEAEIQT
jgi:hypothetical protein